MLEHNIHGHTKYSKIPKKLMVQRAFKQTLHNIKTRPYPLRTTAENDPSHEGRRANCTYQSKECFNQFTQNSIEQPEDSEDSQWRVVRGKKRGQNSSDLITIKK